MYERPYRRSACCCGRAQGEKSKRPCAHYRNTGHSADLSPGPARGLLEIFIQSGAVVSTPTCGPCLGGHMGVLARGERAVATTNRNFVGRMGHPESEVYLASPATAAASAIAGKLTTAEDLERQAENR